jgi:Ino eighty subunit 1
MAEPIAVGASDEQDPRNSIQHVLEDPDPSTIDETVDAGPSDGPNIKSEDIDKGASTPRREQDGGSDAATPQYTSTTTTIRRNANGSVSSVYSGNKIRHLKKEDGVPLWRKDIQYDFLRDVFEDPQTVFHKASDKSPGHTFADIYLDAMAKSSKCSKILKEKLLSDRPAAVNMAMVCLLVNVGRMNTTLNCTSS